MGYGKANEVPVAIQKGVERARRDLYEVPMHGFTITHHVTGVHSASRVLLKPASPGTGVIAGGGVRAVLELAGIHDVLSKSLGSQNPINLVKATMAGLQALRRPEEVAELRGLTVAQVLGLDEATPEPEPEPSDGRQEAHDHPGALRPTGRPSASGTRCARSASGRIGKTAQRPENDAVRGQIHSVSHLLEVK